MNIVAFTDDLFCSPCINRKNGLFLWLALKQKSLQTVGIHSFVCSSNEHLLSTFTVLSADFYQKTPYLVTQRDI